MTLYSLHQNSRLTNERQKRREEVNERIRPIQKFTEQDNEKYICILINIRIYII
jgi:hypothetical protein